MKHDQTRATGNRPFASSPARTGVRPAPALEPLDARKQALLDALIQQHVDTAEPVGSEWLATALSLGVRAATIRNELAEMTDLGYLRQPHTSAGRVPSDRGYRYYVNFLMRASPLPARDRRQVRNLEQFADGDVERLLFQTCRVLSSLTRYTSIASRPTGERPRIRQVHLVQITARRLLAVTVLDAGEVTHRFVELAQDLSPAAVDRLGNALDELLSGQEAGLASLPETLPDPLAEHARALRLLEEAVRDSTAEEAQEPLYLEGTARMLQQPEFRAPERLERLIGFLEERRGAIEGLRQILGELPFAVVIGEENPHPDLRECAFVSARYQAGERLYGWVGVLGPTRMRYEQAVPVVQSAADVLSDVFGRLAAG